MGNRLVHFASLDHIANRILRHLQQSHNTSLIGSPGCGVTTYLDMLKNRLRENSLCLVDLDLRKLELSDFISQVKALQPVSELTQVVVIDHVTDLLLDDFRLCLEMVNRKALETNSLCLWCGPIDARNTDRHLNIKIYSVPSAHISIPILSRDEQLCSYRAIFEGRDCLWGEAILHLMLDFCGNDLALAAEATDYFHGDWSDRLYDESVWDRVQEWFKNGERVDQYRRSLKGLSTDCQSVLSLIRFGAKPRCLRAELLEEVNDALRHLCLNGFLVQNLLPGFYQLRNLTIQFLLDESVRPEVLFRRATNERTGQLLQDVEMMLRHVLSWTFERIGPESVQEQLERMQQPGELIPSDLNKEILKWVKQSCSSKAIAGLNALLLEHRKVFRANNSVWARTMRMLKEDGLNDATESSPVHLQCIDYLNLNELSTLVIYFIDEVFPHLSEDGLGRKRLRERWLEGLSKVRRLRNKVAHLRNISFQDMEDLVDTIDGMRKDLINYGGWKQVS